MRGSEGLGDRGLEVFSRRREFTERSQLSWQASEPRTARELTFLRSDELDSMMSANNAGAAVWARWGNEPSSKLLPDPVRLPSPLPPNRGGGVVSIAFDTSTSSLIERYLRVCRELQVAPCPGVLTFIRLRLAELKPERWNGGSGHIKFGDIEMYAFCDFVLREKAPCAIFEHWTHFDGQGCDFGSTGCQMLARVLGLPESCVHTVDLRNQQIGERGTRALTEVLRVNPRVVHVGLYASFISDAGAKLIVDFLREGGEGVRALETLDLSLNMVSFDMCQELQLVRPAELKLVLKGNRVLDEVLNASSHCVGVILVILGTVFLGISVADKPELSLGPDGAVLSNSGYVASISIYLISLFCLYLASTLYHSMFAMGDAVLTVFAVFDQSAIYLLIAGAYTPFPHAACLPHRMLSASLISTFSWQARTRPSSPFSSPISPCTRPGSSASFG